MNRRNFIRNTTIASAGIGMTSVIPSQSYTAGTPADNVNVALIGCNSMGFGILQHHLANEGVRCTAMCDIDSNVLNERAATIRKNFNQDPKLYGDFRKLLEQKDIDAVIVGTPDHWHCLITVYALEAGKDVYVEKPMANSIGECNVMVKAAHYYKDRIVQVGQQQRSGFIFQKAAEMIRNGQIGKLRRINVWANFNYGAGSKIVPDEPVPAGVDFDMWLGPTPARTFNKTRFHGMWRMFWNYGGGLMSDWGVHLLDAALLAGNITAPPEKVLVYAANTFHEPRSRETFDSMSVVYPRQDFVINWDMTAGIEKGPYNSPYGLVFIGDNATIMVDRTKLLVYPEWDETARKNKAEEYKFTEGKESHDAHVKNFIECVRTRKKPVCPPEVGRVAAMHVHIPNVAGRTGESMLLWDETAGRFTNSEAANKLLTPEYRSPWKLPEF
ncbi:MAG TPA: Gfo/Idh/MocA family oxidoreductase [Bacteroidales bacterium]|nr:Gfo/Idh/MocA family oxidoreductase [Bacteroidales bacterium]